MEILFDFSGQVISQIVTDYLCVHECTCGMDMKVMTWERTEKENGPTCMFNLS
jgi:hypothetical protein